MKEQLERLTIEMLKKDKKAVKKLAAELGISIKKLVIDAIAFTYFRAPKK